MHHYVWTYGPHSINIHTTPDIIISLIILTPIVILFWSLFCFWRGRSAAQPMVDIHTLLVHDQAIQKERDAYLRAKREWEAKLERTKLDTTEECLAIGRKQGYDDGYESGREAGSEEAMRSIRKWVIAFLREQADKLDERPLDKSS